VRDNLVRVFEDKRYAYDGHGRRAVNSVVVRTVVDSSGDFDLGYAAHCKLHQASGDLVVEAANGDVRGAGFSGLADGLFCLVGVADDGGEFGCGDDHDRDSWQDLGLPG
jgi:hypothetical protein